MHGSQIRTSWCYQTGKGGGTPNILRSWASWFTTESSIRVGEGRPLTKDAAKSSFYRRDNPILGIVKVEGSYGHAVLVHGLQLKINRKGERLYKVLVMDPNGGKIVSKNLSDIILGYEVSGIQITP